MKLRSLFSFQETLNRLRASVERFPMTFGLSLALATTALAVFEIDKQEELKLKLSRLIMCLTVALPLQAAVEWLLAERRHEYARWLRLLPVVGGGLFYPLAGFLGADLMRFALVFLSALLGAVLMVSGWKRPPEIVSRRLAAILTAVLVAGVAGAVMNAGLFVIYFAVKSLLWSGMPETVFRRLLIYTPVLLHSTFTLGIYLILLPDAEKTPEESPQWMDFMLRIVALPVLFLYGGVLALYFLKIVVSANLPKGTVAFNVTTYALLGLMAHMLAIGCHRPIFTRFFRWFQISTLVFVPMLVVAVARRIYDYGFTEERLLLILLAGTLLWLGAAFGILGKNRPQWTFVTLIGVALAAVMSPFNIFTISLMSQKARLMTLFEKHQLLVGGRFVSERRTLRWDDWNELSTTLNYLVGTHGPDFVRPFVPQDWNLSLEKPWQDRFVGTSIMNRIALREDEQDSKKFYFHGQHWSSNVEAEEIFPCEFATRFWNLGEKTVNPEVTVVISAEGIELRDKQKERILNVPARALLDHAEKRRARESEKPAPHSESGKGVGPSLVFLRVEGGGTEMSIELQQFELTDEGRITRMTGEIFVRLREPYCRAF